MRNAKAILAYLLAAVTITATACKSTTPPTDNNTSAIETSAQSPDPAERIQLSRIYRFPELDPSDYRYYDYTEHAKQLDALLFDSDATGDFLPLIWQDERFNTFGLAAYAGDHRYGESGGQEAVTTIAAVLSAGLVGIDKSDQGGMNYVSQLLPYFIENEQTVLNNLNGTSATTSMWYQIYPSILFVQTSVLFPDETELREKALQTIESWYKAFTVMAPEGDDPDFNYSGFDFVTMEPYQNNIWKEPDSASGIAVLMDLGFSLTGDEKYKAAMLVCMDYIETYFGGPLYEILQYYGPYLNAKLNALEGKDYDLVKSFGRVFDGASIPRGGWGVISKIWGDYDMSGLFGSTTDRGGYAFSMNTFAGVNSLIPAVKYAPQYGSAIGDFILRATKNSQYFFAANSEAERQSTTQLDYDVADEIQQLLPYEGIINSYNASTPWFGGDPTIHDWALTDFSLYSGAHIGMMAHRIEETDVEGILKVDLNELTAEKQYPFYLLYNPFAETKTIKYTVTGASGGTDIYDVQTRQYLAENIQDTSIEIPPGKAIVLVELPTGTILQETNGKLYADGIFIAVKDE